MHASKGPRYEHRQAAPSAPPGPRVTARQVAVSLRGPGQSPILPFACCVASILSDGRCGWCSLRCRFRISGAQYGAHWVRAGCCGGCLRVLLPTPLHVWAVRHMPPRVSLCVRSHCSTPPHGVLVVHMPPRVALYVRSDYSTFPRGARGHCAHLYGYRRCPARSWWPGRFAPHRVHAGVLGSAHPGFVGGSFPILTTLENRAAGAPSVALQAPHPLRAQTFPNNASGASVLVHWVPPLPAPPPGMCFRGKWDGWGTGGATAKAVTGGRSGCGGKYWRLHNSFGGSWQQMKGVKTKGEPPPKKL